MPGDILLGDGRSGEPRVWSKPVDTLQGMEIPPGYREGGLTMNGCQRAQVHTSLKPQPRGLKPQPRGLKPQLRGLKPQLRGLKPQPRGLKPQPRGLKPQPRGLKPKQWGTGNASVVMLSCIGIPPQTPPRQLSYGSFPNCAVPPASSGGLGGTGGLGGSSDWEGPC